MKKRSALVFGISQRMSGVLSEWTASAAAWKTRRNDLSADWLCPNGCAVLGKGVSDRKGLRINHYRFHTCCPPEAAFVAADEVGMYLEPELPFWGTIAAEGEPEYDKTRQEFLKQEGYDILREYGNHPSFLLFSLGNELWGNPKVLDEILGDYKAVDRRHWYVQGSNNFQFVPTVLVNDDFSVGYVFQKSGCSVDPMPCVMPRRAMCRLKDRKWNTVMMIKSVRHRKQRWRVVSGRSRSSLEQGQRR